MRYRQESQLPRSHRHSSGWNPGPCGPSPGLLPLPVQALGAEFSPLVQSTVLWCWEDTTAWAPGAPLSHVHVCVWCVCERESERERERERFSTLEMKVSKICHPKYVTLAEGYFELKAAEQV